MNGNISKHQYTYGTVIIRFNNVRLNVNVKFAPKENNLYILTSSEEMRINNQR